MRDFRLHSFLSAVVLALCAWFAPMCYAEDATPAATAMTEAPAAVAALEAAKPTLNSGDTAWMLTATALVLFMTIPGLALFYGGMVRSKNVLSVLMQCFAITALVTVLWALYLKVAGFPQACRGR